MYTGLGAGWQNADGETIAGPQNNPFMGAYFRITLGGGCFRY
jgi:hypothetical protein